MALALVREVQPSIALCALAARRELQERRMGQRWSGKQDREPLTEEMAGRWSQAADQG